MAQTYLATLSSKGQLTLPKKLRDLVRLKTGMTVLLEFVRGAILLKKAQIQSVDDDYSEAEWQELKKLAGKKGKTYKDGPAFLASLK